MMQYFSRKRFGQHFLRDLSVIEQIIFEMFPKEGQLFFEIGPGLGALTTQLLPIVKEMQGIEIDRDLIPKLEKACHNLGQLVIHCEDVLKFDFSTLVQGDQKLRIVGNLPYNISTPLLFHLFKYCHLIHDMHFMLQKEVAERMTASVGTSNYGRLTIMTQYYCQTKILLHVPPEAFRPKPKVHSAFVKLIPHEKPLYVAQDVDLLSQIVKRAFMKRRKTIKNALSDFVSEQELKKLGIDPQVRPEQIDLEGYMRIANYRFGLMDSG